MNPYLAFQGQHFLGYSFLKKCKGMFLYSTVQGVSSLLDPQSALHFPLPLPLADMFILAPTQFLGEANWIMFLFPAPALFGCWI